jgi:hypothetical protein
MNPPLSGHVGLSIASSTSRPTLHGWRAPVGGSCTPRRLGLARTTGRPSAFFTRIPTVASACLGLDFHGVPGSPPVDWRWRQMTGIPGKAGGGHLPALGSPEPSWHSSATVGTMGSGRGRPGMPWSVRAPGTSVPGRLAARLTTVFGLENCLAANPTRPAPSEKCGSGPRPSQPSVTPGARHTRAPSRGWGCSAYHSRLWREAGCPPRGRWDGGAGRGGFSSRPRLLEGGSYVPPIELDE